MWKKHEITISRDVTTNTLIITDNGDVIAGRWDKIIWSIKDGDSTLHSFRIAPKGTPPDVLQDPPPPGHARSCKVKVKLFPPRAVYEYSIWWKATENSDEVEHDPKLYIRPSTSAPILFIMGLFGIFFLVNWRLNKMKAKQESKTAQTILISFTYTKAMPI